MRFLKKIAHKLRIKLLNLARSNSLLNRLDRRPVEIDVWYGGQQVFGRAGRPQPDINLLGTLHGPATRLGYRLNNGPLESLSLGPDPRRLAGTGDFNAEIPYSQLLIGKNQVELVAEAPGRPPFVCQVEVMVEQPAPAPHHFVIDWNAPSSLQQRAQVVDGRWQVVNEGVQALESAYDRILAVGDLSWQDVELAMPFTLQALEPLSTNANGAGFGVALRWNGHSDQPVRCSQPRCGWLAQGATLWYGCGPAGENECLKLEDGENTLMEAPGFRVQCSEHYLIKLRVETLPGEAGSRYSSKVWHASQPEPADWLLTGSCSPDAPLAGGVLLIAHHARVVFGNVEVSLLKNAAAQSTE